LEANWAKEGENPVFLANLPGAVDQRQYAAHQTSIAHQRVSASVNLQGCCALDPVCYTSVKKLPKHSKSPNNPQKHCIYLLQVISHCS